jgi:HAMP domain-containing protein
MAMDDFAPAGPDQLHDELDQDLFDFPPMEEPKASAPAPAPEPETAAPAAASAASETTGSTGMDEDLDLDIFDFPPLVDTSRSEAPVIAGGDLEESIEEASKAVSQLLEDDLGEMIEIHERDLQEREAQQAPATQPAAPVPAAALPNPVATPAPITVSASPSKMQWVLVGALVFFMAGALGIAWRLTSSFSASLERVRDDVELGNQTLEVQNAEQMRRIDELQHELLAQQALAQQALASQQGSTSAGSPGQLTARTPAELTILAAEASIASGEFAAARQMLFRDLASADSMPIGQREANVQRMELLIAQSFSLQAQQLQEEGR